MPNRKDIALDKNMIREEFLSDGDVQGFVRFLSGAKDTWIVSYDSGYHKKRWPGLSGQISSLDKWSLCRFAIVVVARREGVARPLRRHDNGGEIHAAAICGRCS